MGTRDEEELEVAKAEMVRLETENAELRAGLASVPPLYQETIQAVLARAERAEARITAALALYERSQDQPIGRSRWRNADEFLVAIRTALTGGNTDD